MKRPFHLLPGLALLAVFPGCRPVEDSSAVVRESERVRAEYTTARAAWSAREAELVEQGRDLETQRATAAVEAGLLRREVDDARARLVATAEERETLARENEKLRVAVETAAAKESILQAMADSNRDWFHFKNGRKFPGRLVEVTETDIALETAPGAVMRGPLSSVQKILVRSAGPKEPDPVAKPAAPAPASTPAPQPAAASPGSTATPSTTTTQASATAPGAAEVVIAGPEPRLRIDVIKRKNQKTSEVSKAYSERMQVVELDFSIRNLDAQLSVTNLETRVWIVAQNVEDADELKVITIEKHPFGIKSGGAWEFSTDAKKLEHVRSPSVLYRRGFRYYGYVIDVVGPGNRVVASKSSPERLEHETDRVRRQKENVVFRL